MKIKLSKTEQLISISFTGLTLGQYAIIKNAIALYEGPAAEEIKKAIDKVEWDKVDESGEDIKGSFRRVID